jgi:hypothetical protein
MQLFKLFTTKSANADHGKSFHSKSGNVTIEKVEPQKKKFDKDNGEYVDYEELK